MAATAEELEAARRRAAEAEAELRRLEAGSAAGSQRGMQAERPGEAITRYMLDVQGLSISAILCEDEKGTFSSASWHFQQALGVGGLEHKAVVFDDIAPGPESHQCIPSLSFHDVTSMFHQCMRHGILVHNSAVVASLDGVVLGVGLGTNKKKRHRAAMLAAAVACVERNRDTLDKVCPDLQSRFCKMSTRSLPAEGSDPPPQPRPALQLKRKRDEDEADLTGAAQQLKRKWDEDEADLTGAPPQTPPRRLVAVSKFTGPPPHSASCGGAPLTPPETRPAPRPAPPAGPTQPCRPPPAALLAGPRRPGAPQQPRVPPPAALLGGAQRPGAPPQRPTPRPPCVPPPAALLGGPPPPSAPPQLLAGPLRHKAAPQQPRGPPPAAVLAGAQETAGPPRRHSAAPRTPPLPVSAAAAEADGESEDESWGCWGTRGKRPAAPAVRAAPRPPHSGPPEPPRGFVAATAVLTGPGGPQRHGGAPRTPPPPVAAAAAEADGESEDESWGCWGASGKRPASPAAEADGEDEAWGASGKRPAAEKELWRNERPYATSNYMVMTLPVREIRFTHDSIMDRFKDGRRLEDLIADLESGRVNPMKDKFLQLDGFRQDARGRHQPAAYFCRNNRRLRCLKDFQERNPQLKVQVNLSVELFKGSAKTAIQALTTVNGGTSVEVRPSARIC